ncbi:NADPH-dependent FMN reductase [Streptomyces incarnatus]|uniref:NADPH-dependent FMN reductase n=1 Tax=Streptomyces incarnatus TaxID=665007 RepID=A0ABM5TX22_9ACTN|nr:NAD(P)H-dependent oxidoreductase [Streptomyces incarnatus]AKJ15693.1 NADPH-dependent FMN reductase [Streptomyces incarnatus]
MLKIGIILASVRDGRRGEQVAQWVAEAAARRTDAEFELVDLLDHPLPHLETEKPALLARGAYEDERTLAWAAAIAPCDGYVIVTPEYNHSMPGSLKNAIDHLYVEWNDKAVGFVSYGVDGGVRSVAQLRQLCGVLQLADVAEQVSLTLEGDFEDRTVFKPRESSARMLDMMLDGVVKWSEALAPLRGVGTTAGPSAAETGQSEIRDRIAEIIHGIQAKNLDALRRIYAPDVISFDVEPPLQHVGVDAKLKNWAKVFTVFQDVSYELRDLAVEVGGDIAFAHAFGRLSGTLATGDRTDGIWARGTFCFRRIDGDWLIVHDQASVPVDVLSGRSAADLEP